MQTYTFPSSFWSLPVEVFWYPSKKTSANTVLLLKGIYGLHNLANTDSWDNEMINKYQGKYNFICINTARKDVAITERSKPGAFTGKTFKEECDDIESAYRYLEDKKVLPENHNLYIIGNSFGGTVLLGSSYLLTRSKGVIMIGSGCGKSVSTTKPLLMTMFDESKLLKSIRSYKGIFTFVRGDGDTVVPRDSQDKIIESVEQASMQITHTVRGTQHNLKSVSGHSTISRIRILSAVLDQQIAMSQGT